MAINRDIKPTVGMKIIANKIDFPDANGITISKVDNNHTWMNIQFSDNPGYISFERFYNNFDLIYNPKLEHITKPQNRFNLIWQ